MSVYAERSKKIFIEGEANPNNEKLLKQWKRNMAMKRLAEGTIYNYEKDIYQWFNFMQSEQGDLEVIDATDDDIEEFVFHCQQEGNNGNRIKRRMSVISSFYKFLKKKKMVTENPVDLLDRPSSNNIKPVVPQVYLTQAQVNDMRKILKEHPSRQLELYALFSLSTMARVTAISNVKWSNLDFDSMQVVDIVEKGGKVNENMYFSKEVKDLLLKEKARREKEGIKCEYIFCTKHKGEYRQASTTTLGLWAKKVGKLIGIENGLHPHDFRHSGATLLKNNGMPLEEVSVLLNHSGTDVTRKFYIKEDNKKLKENKDKFSF